jgi:uncharacterized protein YceK
MARLKTLGCLASILLISALTSSIESCGTIITRSVDRSEDYPSQSSRFTGWPGPRMYGSDVPITVPRVYSGTWFDFWAIHHVDAGMPFGLFFWDIPSSLVADTILLPLTAYEQLRFGSFGNDAPPLVVAAQNGELAIVQALLDRGADANTKTQGGRTALEVAAGRGHAAVIPALLNAGAEVNARSAGMETALMVAVRRGHTTSVLALLDKGADVNASSFMGETALIDAADRGHMAIVQALLDKGADVNAKTIEGRTALDFVGASPFSSGGWPSRAFRAEHYEEVEIRESLRRAGAKD